MAKLSNRQSILLAQKAAANTSTRFAGKRLENYNVPALVNGSSDSPSATDNEYAIIDNSSSSSDETDSDTESSIARIKALKSFNYTHPGHVPPPASHKSDPSSDSEVARSLNQASNSEDSEDESDSDLSIDSATVYLPQLQTPTRQKLKVAPPSKLNLDQESDSELSVISDDALNELEASIALDIATSASENSEYDDENLLAVLSDEESSLESDSDFFDYEDDDSIEQREELAILEEVQRSGDLEEPRLGYESDDVSESDVSFSNDAFFEPRVVPSMKSITSTAKSGVPSDEEDEFLFPYFFSTDEESEQDQEMDKPGLENYSANALAVAMDESDLSGDSTDEDNTLPRSNPKVRARPTEILSTSATTSRPPVLGSWVMSTERPYGIIDGLTTRTLSPPANGSAELVTPAKRSRTVASVSSDSEASELALEDFIYTSELEEDKEDLFSTPVADDVYHNKDIPLSAFRNRGSYSQLSFQQSPLHRRSSSTASRRNSREISLTPGKRIPKTLKKRRKQSQLPPQPQTPSHYHKKKEMRLSLDVAMGSRSPRAGAGNGVLDAGAASTDLIDELVGIGALSPLFRGIA